MVKKKKESIGLSKVYAAISVGLFLGLFALIFLLRGSLSSWIQKTILQNKEVTSPINSSPQLAETPDKDLNKNFETQAWIYPGETTCGLERQLPTISVTTLKPEYFAIGPDGTLVLLTAESHGCNGFSEKNLALLKENSKAQYITISGRYDSMVLLFSSIENQETQIKTLVDFVLANDVAGIEIDFEDFGTWSARDYRDYLGFITRLGTELQAVQKKLLVAGPPISSEIEAGYYEWKYADFAELPVDQLVVMAYDYQADHGAGSPVAPIDWTLAIYEQVVAAGIAPEKIVMGIPAYGYVGKTGEFAMELVTYKQASEHPLFSRAIRDNSSFEMIAENDEITLIYQDRTTLQKKRDVLISAGSLAVSVWHLGNNSWF